jgi:hypothetical protein
MLPLPLLLGSARSKLRRRLQLISLAADDVRAEYASPAAAAPAAAAPAPTRQDAAYQHAYFQGICKDGGHIKKILTNG